MKKWINSLFFGSCFIAAVLIEAYGIVIWQGNLLSTFALGIVVLITGYLFMDSVRSGIRQGGESARFYMDRILSEEAARWNERHTEIMNLQKASYTATKKNSVLLSEQFEGVLTRLEALENNNAKTLQRIVELQKKSLEGQRNALNIEINYNNENTKKILGAFGEVAKEQEISDQLARILEAIENNNRLLQDQMDQASRLRDNFTNVDTTQEEVFTYQPEKNALTENTGFNQEVETENLYNGFSDINTDELLKDLESLINQEESYNKSEAFSPAESYTEAEAFSPEESYTEAEAFLPVESYTVADAFVPMEPYVEADAYSQMEPYAEDKSYSQPNKYIEDTYEEPAIANVEDDLTDINENASDSDWSTVDPSEPEAMNSVEEAAPEVIVTPLYSDPNKSLTADEIAALFASFGK